MKAFRVSKRLRFGLVIVYLLTLASPFFTAFAPDAMAATTTVPPAFTNGGWQFIDRLHVGFFDKSGALVYQLVDGGFDTRLNYGAVNGSGLSDVAGGVCDLSVDSNLDSGAWDNSQPDAQQLSLSSKGLNTITVHWSKKAGPPGNQCQKQPDYTTSITQLQNFNTTYNWISQGEIQRVDQPGNQIYKDSGITVNYTFNTPSGSLSGPKEVYFRENEINKTSCVDFILVADNSFTSPDTRFAYFEEIDTDGHGKKTTYPGDTSNCKIVLSNKTNGTPQAGFITAGNYTASRKIQTGFAGSDSTNTATCAISGAISFIFCPLIDLTNELFGVLKGAVVSLLNNGTLNTKDENVANAYAVWAQFRNLTNVFFVLVFLFIIFSTTLSLGLSNYDVKKMLPRLVIAVILVQFSWLLMQLAFDVSNILAAGIKAFPIFTIHSGTSGVTDAASWMLTVGIAGLFTAGIVLAELIIPFLLLLLSGIIALLGVFITLFLRQFIIIILVVLSPLAFVAWVLPNTENLFKSWSKMLIRLLLMYPLIVLIFSMAGLFSHIQPSCASHAVNGIQQGECSDINSVAAAIIPILAFFMVPWTFKWAGGAMAAVGGFVTNRANRLSRTASRPMSKELKQRYAQHTANRAADRQLKAGTLSQSERAGIKGKWDRTRARAMTGNFGERGDSRLAAAARKAQGEQVKAERDKLELAAVGWSPDDMGENLAAIAGSTDPKVSDYTKRAAQEMMIDKGEFRALSGISGPALDNSPAWKQTKSEKWDSLRDKAGHLLESGELDEKLDKFARKITRNQVANSNKDTLERLFAYGDRHKDDTAVSASYKPDTDGPTPITIGANIQHLQEAATDALGQQAVMKTVGGDETKIIEGIRDL